MKRIISLLISLFVSLFNGVSYSNIGDVAFQEDEYYTIDVADAPDYRSIYGTNPVGGNESSCKSSFESGKTFAKYVKDGATNLMGYSVDSSKQFTLSDDFMSKNTYTFTDNARIIAPYGGTVETKYSGNDGSHMVVCLKVDDKTFTLQINDMERWWCCRKKLTHDSTNSAGEPIWVHTLKDVDGKKPAFRRGDVIGYAMSGTTVTVTQSSTGTATWKALYDID